MLTDVLLYLRNFFCDYSEIQIGTYTISDGAVDLPFLSDGQISVTLTGHVSLDAQDTMPMVFSQYQT